MSTSEIVKLILLIITFALSIWALYRTFNLPPSAVKW